MASKRRLVVVANRLPVHRAGPQGPWEISPGGLVSALQPVLEREGGVWVGWSGVAGNAPRRFKLNGIDIVPVGMSESEVRTAYQGFSNRTLWPLYHDAIRTPSFTREWWKPYETVNRRFADRAAAEVRRGDMVWIHDFHLQLAPGMIREKQPHARIGFFLHIPFPPEELFAWLPWRTPLLEGLLGADVVGFQTESDAANFVRAARRFAGATTKGSVITWQGRQIVARAFPISIDFAAFDELEADPVVQRYAAQIRQRLDPKRKLVLCVDRLDYTKGIDGRMQAFEGLLRAGEITAESTVLVQIAVPTRDHVPEYAAQRTLVEQLVGRINGEHSRVGRMPIHYFRRSLGRRELVGHYLAADVMLVTPLRDGMNLVAKEFVAARRDLGGVLVLSEFAGAAHELGGSLLVNPRDVDALGRTLLTAIHMPREQARARMARLRRAVRTHDVYRWCDTFLEALRA